MRRGEREKLLPTGVRLAHCASQFTIGDNFRLGSAFRFSQTHCVSEEAIRPSEALIGSEKKNLTARQSRNAHPVPPQRLNACVHLKVVRSVTTRRMRRMRRGESDARSPCIMWLKRIKLRDGTHGVDGSRRSPGRTLFEISLFSPFSRPNPGPAIHRRM